MKDKLRELLSLYVLISSDLSTLVDSIDNLYQSEPKVSLEVRIQAFKRDVFAWNSKNKNKYTPDLLNAFYNLWCRIETNGMLKFENEKAFKIGARLATFARMNKQFVKSAQINRLKQAMGSINP